MIKIGLIGAGHLGKIHLRLIKELPEVFELVGIYDSNPSQAAEVSKAYDCKAFSSAEALIDEVDCVDIVTPTTSHFEMASMAIKRSTHVFIEKPVTQTTYEARALLALAEEANVKVQVGHVERFNPAFRAAIPYFDQPMFIETHRLAQFNPRGTDVPVILDLMIHNIDAILSVVKSSVRKISASGVAVVSDTPDIANARIEFDNGCVANLTASRISLKNMRKSRFFQKYAYIAVDFLDKKVEVVKMKSAPKDPDQYALILQNAEGEKKQIYFENPKVQQNNAILEELETFAEAIENDTVPPVSLEQGTAALKVALKVVELVGK